jgi:hypothetical protein
MTRGVSVSSSSNSPDAVHSDNSDDSFAKGEPTSFNVFASDDPRDELDEAQKALEDEQARLHHTLVIEAVAMPVHKRAQEVAAASSVTFKGLLWLTSPR